MLDKLSEARLQEVNPTLADRIRSMSEILEAENIVIRVVQGFRSWKQQQDLYNEGRDSAGNVIDPKAVVTHAKPGHSYHQFGLAVDVAPFDQGIPDWNPDHIAWKRIVTIGESVGLVAGAKWRSFPDFPHFQMTGFLPVSPDEEVRQTFLNSGVQGVWNATGLDT